MRRVCSTVILALVALLLSSTPSVYASETIIYKCVKASGEISFQDFACVSADTVETIHFKTTAADPKYATGLREYELIVLERTHQRLMQEYKLQNEFKFFSIVSGCDSAPL
jgi:hypothetical protein